MLNQEFVFTPLGDPPTINNIVVSFLIIFVMLIMGYVLIYFASKRKIWTFNSVIYGIFLISALYSLFQEKYIKVIKIYPLSNKLCYEYLTITGREGVVTIDVLAAKYLYKFLRNRHYSGCILILKDKYNELQVKESRRPNGKRNKNVLSLGDMNRMDSVIMQIRNRPNSTQLL